MSHVSYPGEGEGEGEGEEKSQKWCTENHSFKSCLLACLINHKTDLYHYCCVPKSIAGRL